jgi:hypothetical protein
MEYWKTFETMFLFRRPYVEACDRGLLGAVAICLHGREWYFFNDPDIFGFILQFLIYFSLKINLNWHNKHESCNYSLDKCPNGRLECQSHTYITCGTKPPGAWYAKSLKFIVKKPLLHNLYLLFPNNEMVEIGTRRKIVDFNPIMLTYLKNICLKNSR